MTAIGCYEGAASGRFLRLKTGSNRPFAVVYMETYRIEETIAGWALFKGRSVRPTMTVVSQDELIQWVAPLLVETGGSVRIINRHGGFQELRF